MTGEYEEKHAKRASGPIDTAFTDKATHLYRLVVRPDSSFEIYLDDKVRRLSDSGAPPARGVASRSPLTDTDSGISAGLEGVPLLHWPALGVLQT